MSIFETRDLSPNPSDFVVSLIAGIMAPRSTIGAAADRFRKTSYCQTPTYRAYSSEPRHSPERGQSFVALDSSASYRKWQEITHTGAQDFNRRSHHSDILVPSYGSTASHRLNVAESEFMFTLRPSRPNPSFIELPPAPHHTARSSPHPPSLTPAPNRNGQASSYRPYRPVRAIEHGHKVQASSRHNYYPSLTPARAGDRYTSTPYLRPSVRESCSHNTDRSLRLSSRDQYRHTRKITSEIDISIGNLQKLNAPTQKASGPNDEEGPVTRNTDEGDEQDVCLVDLSSFDSIPIGVNILLQSCYTGR